MEKRYTHKPSSLDVRRCCQARPSREIVIFLQKIIILALTPTMRRYKYNNYIIDYYNSEKKKNKLLPKSINAGESQDCLQPERFVGSEKSRLIE